MRNGESTAMKRNDSAAMSLVLSELPHVAAAHDFLDRQSMPFELCTTNGIYG
jgi:hypothetical protein